MVFRNPFKKFQAIWGVTDFSVDEKALASLRSKSPTRKEEEKRENRANRGARLTQLKLSEGWQELERLKASVQVNSINVAINPASSDKQRAEASGQYATIQNFFNEIDRRIVEGEKAQKEIQEELKAKKK